MSWAGTMSDAWQATSAILATLAFLSHAFQVAQVACTFWLLPFFLLNEWMSWPELLRTFS